MQVLSNSVAKALQLTQGDEVAETITFVDKFNKLFDTLNVSSISVGKLKRNPFKDPYRSASDFRLKVRYTVGLWSVTVSKFVIVYIIMHVQIIIVTYYSGWKRNSSHTWMLGRKAWRLGKASQKPKKIDDAQP